MDIRCLTNEEDTAREEALQLAAYYLASSLPLSIEQVQELYDVVLDGFPHNPKARIAVGIAFGETIAAKSGYEWVRVTDEYGAETSLAPRGMAVVCHPISMIQKRIDGNESVKLAELRDETIEVIEDRISLGFYAKRAV